MKTNPDFEYIGKIDFSDEEDKIPKKMILEYEKKKYKYSIRPEIKRLEKELKNRSIEDKLPYDYTEKLLKQKIAERMTYIQYENKDIYPKDIKPPGIIYIQEAEPYVLITGESDSEEDWYRLHDLIRPAAEEAFLTYNLGCWLASISSAITCCEYILKYELFRRLNIKDKNKLHRLLLDSRLTFGNLINDSSHIAELGIEQFKDNLLYLNNVRNAIYHFNPSKEQEVKKKGRIEIERSASVTDEIVLPIIAFRIYEIMQNLIGFFYNKEKAIEYYKEGIADWKRKRNIR